MENFPFQFSGEDVPFAIQMADVLVVACLIYLLLRVARGARVWRLIGGVAIYLIVWSASGVLGLHTLHFLLDRALILGPVALVILFLPELRSALEGFGKLGFWPERLGGGEEATQAMTVEEIVAAVSELSAGKTGALIVIERSRKMPEIERNGVMLEARVTAPLLCSLFYGTNPLHDGAVMIRGDTIVAAACRLPLSGARMRGRLHLRHRAAVGITEETDAVAIVVSEERGAISVSLDGRLREDLTPAGLRELLNSLLRESRKPRRPLIPLSKRKDEGVSIQ
ncbi:MAG: TIGR00159 family protein [Armatimonadetes bacterium]|nr:TIGR00159 family protein [Armatimonadota bacterium]